MSVLPPCSPDPCITAHVPNVQEVTQLPEFKTTAEHFDESFTAFMAEQKMRLAREALKKEFSSLSFGPSLSENNDLIDRVAKAIDEDAISIA